MRPATAWSVSLGDSLAEGHGQTLPREERLRKRAEFTAVQSRGKKLHSPHFVVFVLSRDESGRLAPARLGVTVTKKVGGAVVRNRIKRLVREGFRRQKTLFPRGLDVVFVAKQAAVGIELEALLKEIERLCRKLPRG